jgi:hypothetical protein
MLLKIRRAHGDLEDDPSTGQPLTALNAKTDAKVRELVDRHHRVILKLVEDQGTLTGKR